ncbi:MAG TPA: tellurium resistance protein TerC [Actinobacteria bacterium]|nr:tellurium resistance protein TerC [Actinomycetota bacterium]
MDVSIWVWLCTIGLLVGLLAVDVFIIGRRPHEPSLRECVIAITLYIALALIFGLVVLFTSGPRYAGEFYAGWLTEYSLSIDNLFVFVIIMARLAVPRPLQQTALLVGIILALVMRGIFIGLGAAAINQFSWVFYIFGAFLIVTAVRLSTHSSSNTDDEDEYEDNVVLRSLKRRLPASEGFHGVRLFARENGRRMITPMLVVIFALGTTDLLFALDSIPAIYGLTKEPYLVFAANVFALMGLRQLYFLIGDLLTRLVFLSYGLAFLLLFIGVKLVLHAMHENTLPFVNGGRPVGWAPDIPISVSLGVILATLLATTVASLLWSRRSGPGPRTPAVPSVRDSSSPR